MSSTDREEGREGDVERVGADELGKVPPGSAEEVTDDDAVGGGGGDWTTRPETDGDLTDEPAARSQSGTVGDVGPPTTSGDVRTTGETAGSGWTAGGGMPGAEGEDTARRTDDVAGEPGASRRRDDDEEVLL